MEYYSAIERREFESVSNEAIIQSEINQKEKYKYHILMHVYMESRKMALMNLLAGQQWRNGHREQMGMGDVRRERVRCMETVTRKLTFSSVQSLSHVRLFATP